MMSIALWTAAAHKRQLMDADNDVASSGRNSVAVLTMLPTCGMFVRHADFISMEGFTEECLSPRAFRESSEEIAVLK
jgi:hypothetical protein